MRTKASRRRAISIFAAVSATAIILAGCSGGADPSQSGEGDSITMWTFKQPHLAALQAAAETFKEETGITVDVQAVTPDDAFTTKVQASAQSGDLPDVLEVHSDGEDRVLGGSGVLVDLGPLLGAGISDAFIPSIADSGIVTAEQAERATSEGASDAGIVEGARYGIPFTIGTFGIIYANKEKLAAVGITEAPTTWEEFTAGAAATSEADPANGGISLGFQAISIGLNWIGNQLGFAQLGEAGFGDLYGDDTASDWGSASGKEVLDLYSQLDGKWMPGTQTLTIDDADLAFLQGKAAWAVGGTFTLGFLNQNGMDLDNVIAFPLPAPENGAVDDLKLAPIALTSLAITKDAKNTDAAAQWLEYLASPEVATQFAIDATDLPATDLGPEAADVLGQNLATLTAVFEGTPEQTFDVGTIWDYTPPSMSNFDDLGAVVAKLSPLEEVSVDEAAAQMQAILQNLWASAE